MWGGDKRIHILALRGTLGRGDGRNHILALRDIGDERIHILALRGQGLSRTTQGSTTKQGTTPTTTTMKLRAGSTMVQETTPTTTTMTTRGLRELQNRPRRGLT